MGDTNISPPSMARLNSEVAAVSAKIMVTSMIVLFFIVAFCFFLCLYAKWHWSRNDHRSTTRRGTLTQGLAAAQRRGLDSDTLRSLPVVVYDPKEFKELLECSVCLSEISQGEKVRVLPKCNHGFHVECIDMWFTSHSTCPLCRNSPTRDLSDSDSELNARLEDVVQVRSLEEGSGSSTTRKDDQLVIEIPRDLSDEGLSSPPLTTRLREEEAKTPVVSRLGSLKRMLSRGKRVIPSGSTDVELV